MRVLYGGLIRGEITKLRVAVCRRRGVLILENAAVEIQGAYKGIILSSLFFLFFLIYGVKGRTVRVSC